MWVCVLVLSASGGAREFSPAQLYFESKQAEMTGSGVLAVVEVTGVKDKFLCAEGEYFPYALVTVRVIDRLSGSWTPSQSCDVAVYHQHPCPNQRYLIFATPMESNQQVRGLVGQWQSKELSLLRGSADDPYLVCNPNDDFLPFKRPELLCFRLVELREWLARQTGPFRVQDLSSPELRLKRVQSWSAEENSSLTPQEACQVLGELAGSSQHEHSYRSIALLMELAGRHPEVKESVVASLRRQLSSSFQPTALAAACALADLGCADGRSLLQKTCNSKGESLASSNVGPQHEVAFGRFHYDMEGEALSAAYYLGRLGWTQGLNHKQIQMRLANASGLVDEKPALVVPALTAIYNKEQVALARLVASGKLKKPREKSDHVDRYPSNWVRAASLLARTGSDRHLCELVRAWLADLATYPQTGAKLGEAGMRVVRSSGHTDDTPSLAQAILQSDSDSTRLLSRLQRNFAKTKVWKSEAMLELRRALADSTAPPAPVAATPDYRGQVEKLLASSVPKERERGLVAAAQLDYQDIYPRVLQAALTTTGQEQAAAIYALSLFDKPLDDGTSKQLQQSVEDGNRGNLLELLTRERPERFEIEIWEFFLKQQEVSPKSFEGYGNQELSSRLLARLFRTNLPAQERLATFSAAAKLSVLKALYESGNVTAVPLLKSLGKDSDPKVSGTALSVLKLMDSSENTP